jgi:hypothetical protein
VPSALLVLGFASVLTAGILLTSSLRNRSLGEVLKGVTSPSEDKAQAVANVEGSPAPTATAGASSKGGGTAGAQKTFGEEFAKLSGLNPSVVDAWLLHEQPAGSPSKPGSNNWLNIQYTDSGPNATYFQIAALPARQAAQASVEWLRKQPGLASILQAAGHGEAAEVTAIEDSGWASSHYGNESPSAFLGVG